MHGFLHPWDLSNHSSAGQFQGMVDRQARDAASFGSSPASTPENWRRAAILVGIFIITIGTWQSWRLYSEAAKAERHAVRAQALKETRAAAVAEWQPMLARALQSYDPAADIQAIARARALSPCFARAIDTLVAGRTLNAHCRGTAPLSDRRSGPVYASINFSDFTVGYFTERPLIRHRLEVKALTRTALSDARRATRQSAAATVVERLGPAVAASLAGRGCVAISAQRVASNRGRNGEPASPEGATPEVFASRATASIACPVGSGRFALTKTVSFAYP